MTAEIMTFDGTLLSTYSVPGERVTERKKQRERERDRDRERETERERQRQTDRQRETDRERQTDRERFMEVVIVSAFCPRRWLAEVVGVLPYLELRFLEWLREGS